ncbi:hypothetical protein B0H13DRAFT_789095 [Mycena leptocephala]|nr:hypothetical protein B0H13DRAFT_789095 [Mycena leptocephala]
MLGGYYLIQTGDATVAMQADSLWTLHPHFPRIHRIQSRRWSPSRLSTPFWHSVAGVIASDQASPAAKRLALRLAFAAFVIGPCLCSKSEHRTPYNILEALDRYLDQTRATGFSASRVGAQLAIQERLNFAMIVSLYATTNREHRNFANASQLRPHSLGCLLNILQNVLHPDDSVSSLQLAIPPEDLDPAQIVLIRWGDTISWCWETWDDHRVANAESIVFLTAIWLRHLDVHFFQARRPFYRCLYCLKYCNLASPPQSCTVHVYGFPINGPPVSMVLISRACFYAVNR